MNEEYKIISTEDLIEKLKGEVTPPTLPVGVDSLDRLFGGGIAPGEMISLAGWPGNGKTEFATFWTKTLSPGSVLWFEYECSEREFMERYSFKPPIFYIPDKYKSRDIYWLLEMVRKARTQYPSVRFVFIDAIQSAMNLTKGFRPDLQIGAVMSQLREISNEMNAKGGALNIVMINRVTKPNANEDKREMEMGDVPGSADIEHEVDFSIYVQRIPNSYNPWINRKQRMDWYDERYDEFGNRLEGDNHVLLKIVKRRPQRAKVGKALLELLDGKYQDAKMEWKKETKKPDNDEEVDFYKSKDIFKYE